jgi:phosphinothricin acetyltransferase
MIRDANRADAGAISAVYNHYINNTVITFEEIPVSPEEIQNRIALVQAAGLPWLVYADQDSIIGYAYAGKWHSRSAYRYAVETTVYLQHDQTGRGIGSSLYTEMLKRLAALNYHTAIGGIALPNAASIALHEKLGYRKVAHYQETGYKFGRWIDVGYWQLMLKNDAQS